MFGLLVKGRSVYGLRTTRFVYKEAHAKAARVSFLEETTRFANICSMITFQLLFLVVGLKLFKVCAGVGEPAGTKLYRERSDSL